MARDAAPVRPSGRAQAGPLCLSAEQVELCLGSDDWEGLMLYLRFKAGHGPGPTVGLGRALTELDGRTSMEREARDVLAALNDASGKRFRPTEANLAPIVALLAQGRSPADLRAVAADLARRWGSDGGTASMVKPSRVFDGDTFADHLLLATRDGARADFSRFSWSKREGGAP